MNNFFDFANETLEQFNTYEAIKECFDDVIEYSQRANETDGEEKKRYTEWLLTSWNFFKRECEYAGFNEEEVFLYFSIGQYTK